MRPGKPTKVPQSMADQKNTPCDQTSHFEAPKPLVCWHCNERMPGDMGVMRAVKLAGSDIRIHVVLHVGCQDHA